MLKFAMLAAAVPLSAAYLQTSAADLARQPEYSFKHYVREYSKSYAAEEYMKREAIFARNLAKIREHNAAGHDWTMGLNPYTDWSEEEFAKVSKGLRGNVPHMPAAQATSLRAGDLPASVDWRTKNVVTPVKNQAACGSCWAFSAVETIESHTAIATGKLLKLSPQQVVSCTPNPNECGGTGGCKGATQVLAFNYTHNAGGLTTAEDYPYSSAEGITWPCNHNRIKPVVSNDGYVQLPTNNYTALMEAVATKGPIAISAAAAPWQLYEGGIFSSSRCGFEVDHGIQLVGYGAEGDNLYWIVRNSWGASWGESGYIRIRRYGEGKEPCGMDTKPQTGLACKGEDQPIKYCGECGILSYSSYPTGMHLI